MLYLVAILLCNSVLSAQTPSARKLFDAASEAESRGDLSAAASAYQAVINVAPNNVPARVDLAGVQMQLGHYAEACGNYLAASRQVPSDVRITILHGNCLVVSGREADAIRLLAPAEKLHAQNLDVAFLLGEAMIHQGRLAEGLRRVETVAHAREDANAWMLAGLTELQLGNAKQAVQSLSEALRLAPAMPGAYTSMGIARSLTGDTVGAEAAFLKALAANPDDFEASLRVGTLLRQDGALPEAARHINHAVSLQPSSLTARYQLAELEVAQDQRARAADDLEIIERVAPNVLEVHEQLAALDFRLHRIEAGEREKRMVDHLLAAPQEQDHRLEGAVLVSRPRSK